MPDGPSIYQSHAQHMPDSEFEPGRLKHLMPGRRGRMLDWRRTPVHVARLDWPTGQFVLHIDDFEDAGAIWQIPFEKVDRYQFEPAGERASQADQERMQEAIARFNRPLHVARSDTERPRTMAALTALTHESERWLRSRRSLPCAGEAFPDPESRTGNPALYGLLRERMADCNLDSMEQTWARQFVSNPHAGECVKGHAIALAEMGLVEFRGTRIRDAQLFDPPWDKACRTRHILVRLAFVRSLFRLLGQSTVTLYRGWSTTETVGESPCDSFISASFSRAVAQSHFEAAGVDANGQLMRQRVAVERLFMTFYETAELNITYREAEAVLLRDGVHDSFGW